MERSFGHTPLSGAWSAVSRHESGFAEIGYAKNTGSGHAFQRLIGLILAPPRRRAKLETAEKRSEPAPQSHSKAAHDQDPCEADASPLERPAQAVAHF